MVCLTNLDTGQRDMRSPSAKHLLSEPGNLLSVGRRSTATPSCRRSVNGYVLEARSVSELRRQRSEENHHRHQHGCPARSSRLEGQLQNKCHTCRGKYGEDAKNDLILDRFSEADYGDQPKWPKNEQSVAGTAAEIIPLQLCTPIAR